MTQATVQDRTLEELEARIANIVASKASEKYRYDFLNGPPPSQPERINAAGERVNYKKTKDEAWIAHQREIGAVLYGTAAEARPKGGTVEIDGHVEVDIVSTPYDHMPEDLKDLNRQGAKIAANEMIRAASNIHDRWVMNNLWQVAETAGNDRIYSIGTVEGVYGFVQGLSDEQRDSLSQFVPFDHLTPYEQDKDFVFVTTASGVLDQILDPDTVTDEIEGIELGKVIAQSVHNDWVMRNLQKVVDATLDHSVLECNGVDEVFAYVAEQSEHVRERLSNFVPFDRLSRERQDESIRFAVDATQHVQSRMADARQLGGLS